MKRFSIFAVAVAIALAATAITVQAQIHVTSSPSDAAIYINGKDSWESTPATIMPKGSKFTLELRKMGYENTKMVVAKEADPITKKKVFPAEVSLSLKLAGAPEGQTGGGNHEEDPKYGDTREQRIETLKNLNFLQDEINEKRWNDAALLVKVLMNDAPAASANIYIWGASAYRGKAQGAKTLAEKKVFVDSLMLIYDRRVEHFGGEATKGGTPYILQLKARDYSLVNPMDREGVRAAYKAAVDAGEGKATGELVVEYFKNLVDDLAGFTVEESEVLAEFERLYPMMEGAGDTDMNNFVSLLVQSGAATCGKLEPIYEKKLATDPGNVDVLKTAYKVLSAIDCSSNFYVGVAEKYYAAEPSTAVAVRLASVFETREEYAKALKYLYEVLPEEKDPKAKAAIYIRIATAEIGGGHSNAAGSAARQAIAIDGDNGVAHMLLAEAYVAGAAACGGFTTNTVYWLAYDEFARARALFTDPAQIAHIDARMSSCRSRFPKFEDGFMHVDGYADGRSYTVNCGWISGTTTIRSR